MLPQATSPKQVTLVVAGLDEPGLPAVVTQHVISLLHQQFDAESRVHIIALDHALPLAEGEAVARAEGEQLQAAMVLWGRQKGRGEQSVLNVHVELLQYLPNASTQNSRIVRSGPPFMVALPTSFFFETSPTSETSVIGFFTAGLVKSALQDWGGARMLLDNALSASTRERLPLTQSAIYFFRGFASRALGNFDEAIADYTKSVQLTVDFSEAYINRGEAYGVKKAYEQAIADCTQSIRLKPDFAEAYFARASYYNGQENADLALADYNQAILLRPNYAEAYYSRASIYAWNKKDNDRALADYNHAIQLKPDYAEAYYSRASIYAWNKKDNDRALADYNHAIQLKSDYAEAYYGRAGVYAWAKEDYDRALADYDHAIQLKPDYA